MAEKYCGFILTYKDGVVLKEMQGVVSLVSDLVAARNFVIGPNGAELASADMQEILDLTNGGKTYVVKVKEEYINFVQLSHQFEKPQMCIGFKFNDTKEEIALLENNWNKFYKSLPNNLWSVLKKLNKGIDSAQIFEF